LGIRDKPFNTGRFLQSGKAVIHVAFRSRDKVHAPGIKRIKEFEVDIRSIHDQDAVRHKWQISITSHFDIVTFAVRDDQKGRKTSAMLQKAVNLQSAFRLAVLRPGIERQAEFNNRGVERIERIFETKPVLWRYSLTSVQQAIKYPFEYP